MSPQSHNHSKINISRGRQIIIICSRTQLFLLQYTVQFSAISPAFIGSLRHNFKCVQSFLIWILFITVTDGTPKLVQAYRSIHDRTQPTKPSFSWPSAVNVLLDSVPFHVSTPVRMTMFFGSWHRVDSPLDGQGFEETCFLHLQSRISTLKMNTVFLRNVGHLPTSLHGTITQNFVILTGT